MTKLLSALEARNTKIFVIENGEVVETTLFNHVIESAEETTSPRGVMHKMFIDEIDVEEFDSEDQYVGTTQRYILREWQANGRSRELDRFNSEEAANDEWYTRTYNYDFTPDDQRDTRYWFTRDEAEKEMNEC
jgi:hypothetical protein